LKFYDLSKKEQKFYRDFYPSVEIACSTMEQYFEIGDIHEIRKGEKFLIKLFKIISKKEKDIIGDNVNISELKITDDEYFEIFDKLYYLREQVEKEFDNLLIVSFLKESRQSVFNK